MVGGDCPAYKPGTGVLRANPGGNGCAAAAARLRACISGVESCWISMVITVGGAPK